MKSLVLVRHAKSSWDDEALADRDRPLNARGRRDAPVMGSRLAAQGTVPDVVWASPAVRARTTADLLTGAVGFDPAAVTIEPRLYHAGIAGYWEVIRSLPPGAQRAMLVGHNPTMTDLVNALTDLALANLPTCGIVTVSFGAPTWGTIGPSAVTHVYLDYPKKPAGDRRP